MRTRGRRQRVPASRARLPRAVASLTRPQARGLIWLAPGPSVDNTTPPTVERLLAAIRKRWPWVKHLFADSAYDRGKLMDKAEYLDFVIEVIRRMEGQQGFEVLPRRWVVERSE